MFAAASSAKVSIFFCSRRSLLLVPARSLLIPAHLLFLLLRSRLEDMYSLMLVPHDCSSEKAGRKNESARLSIVPRFVPVAMCSWAYPILSSRH
jgi:hypothetical protein